MSIAATGSGATLAQSLKQNFKGVFDAAKKSFQESGHVANVSEQYASKDGNVSIKLSGKTLDNGREVLELSYNIRGAQGAALGRYRSGGIDERTGQAEAPGTRHGDLGGSASSDAITGLQDIDNLESNAVASALDTQEQGGAGVQHWGIGNGQVTDSLAEYQAYNRQQDAMAALANKITDGMHFDDPQAAADFSATLNKSLMGLANGSQDVDLSGLVSKGGGTNCKRRCGRSAATIRRRTR